MAKVTSKNDPQHLGSTQQRGGATLLGALGSLLGALGSILGGPGGPGANDPTPPPSDLQFWSAPLYWNIKAKRRGKQDSEPQGRGKNQDHREGKREESTRGKRDDGPRAGEMPRTPRGPGGRRITSTSPEARKKKDSQPGVPPVIKDL